MMKIVKFFLWKIVNDCIYQSSSGQFFHSEKVDNQYIPWNISRSFLSNYSFVGNYPAALIDACRDYEENGKINKINPFLYPSSQNYLLLSIEEAGLTLEDFSVSLTAHSLYYLFKIANYKNSIIHLSIF